MPDYTAQLTAAATMDRETLDEYRKVCDPRDIAKDHVGKPVLLPNVFGESPGTAAPNYSPERPLKVEGVELCDRLMDVQDALDLRDRKQRLGVKDDPPSAA